MAVSGPYIAAAIGAASTVAVADDANRRATHTKEDAERAKLKAETDATNNANARIKAQRQAMGLNSLSTGGGSSGVPGRNTLGV